MLRPAELAFTPDGVPFSPAYGDIYHSAAGGLAQARHVFLAGNDLPARWRGRESFTIVETGFGLGLNFLATRDALRRDSAGPRRLHFVSVEKHPFDADDLPRALAGWPELAPLARELIGAWPPLVAGFHRLHLDAGRVALTLLFGDAAEMLCQLDARADALFLDGFSPAANPDCWSPAVCRELARIAAPGATLATWSVAGAVRAALGEAGFSLERRPGFGAKREMLIGRRAGATSAEVGAGARRALVIGAGLAGTACAERLAARDWQVTLIERHPAPAQEASGNPAALLRPIVNRGNSTQAQFSRLAHPYAIRHLASLVAEGHRVPGGRGVLQLAFDAGESEKLSAIFETIGLPADYARVVDAAQASALAGWPVAAGGLWFASGAWLDAGELCRANLRRHPERIDLLAGRAVATLRAEQGCWVARDGSGSVIAGAPVAVLANAWECRTLAPQAALPLGCVRGQLSFIPSLREAAPRAAVCGDGYAAPLAAGGVCVGATFRRDWIDALPTEHEHRENLARLERLLPGFASGISPAALGARVAWRSTTPDRMPVYGETEPGLWIATGLGARGLLWTPLGAEFIASRICGDASPVAWRFAAAIDPARFNTRL